MSKHGDDQQESSNLLAELEERLRSGEADRVFASCAPRVTEAVAKLQEAERMDPDTLKLTVTI